MIVISGYTPDDKVPGAVGKNEYGTGKRSVGSIALKCVLMGGKTSGGSAVVETLYDVTTPEEAATYFGIQSELANMAYAALDTPGVTLQCIAVAEAGGAAAATSTLTIAGTWTESGQITIQLDDTIIDVAFDSTMTTVTLAAAQVVAIVNQAYFGRLFCTASNVAGVVTFTTASKGVRQNQHTLFIVDQNRKPSGMTLAIAGGTALSNGGVPFSGGSGTDSVDLALTAMDGVQNDYIGAAHNDTTNVGKIETKVNAKAAFDVGLLEQYVVSSNGTQAAAIALGQAQMNDVLGMCLWVPLGVQHPSRIAARVAAQRSVTEGADPNHNYDNEPINGAAPHFRSADSPSRAVLKAALNASLTPCKTIDGKLCIVRAITSKSLTGATPDYRALDIGCAAVPIRIRKEMIVLFDDLKAQNPNAGPDLDDGVLPPTGMLTPGMWAASAQALMKTFEERNWVTEVDANPVQAEWDDDADRIMSVVTTVVTPLDHQLGVIVRQQAT